MDKTVNVKVDGAAIFKAVLEAVVAAGWTPPAGATLDDHEKLVVDMANRVNKAFRETVSVDGGPNVVVIVNRS